MPSSFGQWLIVILALLVGTAAGWALRGRQDTSPASTPIVEGDPVAGVAVASSPTAEATVEEQRPEAAVAAVSAPAAVLDRPSADTADPTTPGRVLGDADPTAFTPTEADGTPAAATGTSPVDGGPRDDAPTGDGKWDYDAVDGGPADPVVARPAEPVTEPVEPTPTVNAQPVEPAAEPVEPAAEPVEPAAEPVEPAAEPVEPAAEPVEPAAEPVEPAAEPVEPAAEPVEPVAVGSAEAAAASEDTTPAIPAPRPPAEDAVLPAADEAEAHAAPAVAGPASTESADDFRRIQGIGPKMAAALQDAGIRTYQQLADLDEATLRATIRTAGLRATPSLATWPQQAMVLAGAATEAGRLLPTGGTDD
ncbi:helix-hairpin-helix domain-containing protein [Micromonospora sp. ATCC 39149]|uniref:helix-hairpin-helix domain-containing protein n=1 Tax=Micromonospora sp. (strain ATCC 39149 / NRRL 15099 / SCC 1413) TaxID=219305 RepID=UPI0002E8E12C|nr:helix-hairpin-helix domain-containing protein [Micromonospora sp. ATCC 39149]